MQAIYPQAELHLDDRDNGFESIYASIRDAICLGDLDPGAVLTENALAARFGVSRTPIRRVLQRLEAEGLVTTKEGLGTIVTVVDVISLKEIYDLRIRLAELLGELSPNVRVAQEDLAEMAGLVLLCRELRDRRDPHELGRVNMEYHEVLMRLVTNRPLRKYFSQLYYQTAKLWLRLLPGMDWAEEVAALEEEYASILRHLEANDLRAASLVHRDHIARSYRRILAYLGGS